jgi:uncharacterized protein (DUF58 family)
MRFGDLRLRLIALLALAAVLSAVGNKLDARWLVALSFALFAVAVFLIMRARRGARVFDREAKTGETRTRTDE